MSSSLPTTTTRPEANASLVVSLAPSLATASVADVAGTTGMFSKQAGCPAVLPLFSGEQWSTKRSSFSCAVSSVDAQDSRSNSITSDGTFDGTSEAKSDGEFDGACEGSLEISHQVASLISHQVSASISHEIPRQVSFQFAAAVGYSALSLGTKPAAESDCGLTAANSGCPPG